MQTEPKTPVKEFHDVIIDAAAEYYHTDPVKFRVNTRKAINAETAYRKHVCYYIIRNYTFMSYDQIALLFNTGQSTIKCGVNKINDLLTYHRRTIAEVKELKKLIDNFKENSRPKSLAQ